MPGGCKAWGFCPDDSGPPATKRGFGLTARAVPLRPTSSRGEEGKKGYRHGGGTRVLKGVQAPRRLASHKLGRAVALAARCAHGRRCGLDDEGDWVPSFKARSDATRAFLAYARARGRAETLTGNRRPGR